MEDPQIFYQAYNLFFLPNKLTDLTGLLNFCTLVYTCRLEKKKEDKKVLQPNLSKLAL